MTLVLRRRRPWFSWWWLSLWSLAFSTSCWSTAAAAETWIVRTDLWGNPAFSTLSLTRQATALSGDMDGDLVTGRTAGSDLTFEVRDSKGRVSHYAGRRDGDLINGIVEAPDTSPAGSKVTHKFSAWALGERPAGPPRTLEFKPHDYSNTWNADRPPVAVLWPGDTVKTTTLDSGGVDEKGVTQALFGNPQTGPFFVAGATPGDTLVIHLKALRLNRDYADSLDTIVGRALGGSLLAEAANLGKAVLWRLDLKSGVARPESAEGVLAAFSVPVKPMLGGLGVAPGFGSPPISTGDTGKFGGNMDFNEVVEGATVYLPVFQPGALLYLGDGHARQGDGETTQYALETSMDVTFSVDLIKAEAISTPRVESPSQIMVLGQAGSLDEALRLASVGMIAWLERDYGLNLSQSAQVLGVAARMDVATLAGQNLGVAVKIDKSLLPSSRHVLTRP